MNDRKQIKDGANLICPSRLLQRSDRPAVYTGNVSMRRLHQGRRYAGFNLMLLPLLCLQFMPDLHPSIHPAPSSSDCLPQLDCRRGVKVILSLVSTGLLSRCATSDQAEGNGCVHTHTHTHGGELCSSSLFILPVLLTAHLSHCPTCPSSSLDTAKAGSQHRGHQLGNITTKITTARQKEEEVKY